MDQIINFISISEDIRRMEQALSNKRTELRAARNSLIGALQAKEAELNGVFHLNGRYYHIDWNFEEARVIPLQDFTEL